MHRCQAFWGFGLIILVFSLFTFLGCGDDTKAPTTPTEQVGDPEDPEFAAIQEQINNYLTESAELFDLGLGNIYQLPADSDEVRGEHAAFGPNDTVMVSFTGGWYVTYVARHNTFFDDFFRDSVQFQANGTPIEDANGLDYLHYIRFWGYEDNQTDYTHTNRSGHLDFVFENLDQNNATINGTNNILYDWNYISDDSTVEASFDMEVVVEDVTVAQVPNYGWVSGCPFSGSLTMVIDGAWVVNDGSTVDMTVFSWEAEVTYTSGTANVKVSRNNVAWEYTYDICTPQG